MSKPDIVVINLNQRKNINERYIKKLARKILEVLKKEINLEIVFLDDKGIRSLNKRFKHRDAPTDVLSFRIEKLGNIIISSDTAYKNAGIFKSTFEDEIVLYLVHGILHLFGYVDYTKEDFKKMVAKQERIMTYLCEREDLSKVSTPQ